MNWLQRVLSRGGPQTKKLAYLWGVLVTSIWLTIGLWVPIRPEWNVALALFLGAVTTGYVGGKKVAVSATTAPGDGDPVGCANSQHGGTSAGGGNP